MSLEVLQIGGVTVDWTLDGEPGSVAKITAVTVTPDTAGVVTINADEQTASIIWGADVVTGVVVSVTAANMDDGTGELVVTSDPFDLVAAPVVVKATANAGKVKVA